MRYGLCYSDGNEDTKVLSFRPVITLKSNIQLDPTNTGDGTSPEQAYVIK